MLWLEVIFLHLHFLRVFAEMIWMGHMDHMGLGRKAGMRVDRAPGRGGGIASSDNDIISLVFGSFAFFLRLGVSSSVRVYTIQFGG